MPVPPQAGQDQVVASHLLQLLHRPVVYTKLTLQLQRLIIHPCQIILTCLLPQYWNTSTKLVLLLLQVLIFPSSQHILHVLALQLKSSSTQQLQQLLHWCLRPASLAVSTEGPAVLLIISEVASAHQTTVGLSASMKKVSLCRLIFLLILLFFCIFRTTCLSTLHYYSFSTWISISSEFTNNSSCNNSIKENEERQEEK